MKAMVLTALFVALFSSDLAAAAAVPRTIEDVAEATTALRTMVSPKFYKSLLVSPVDGWITVRADRSGDRTIGARVIRSDLNGKFDSLALELANNLQIRSRLYGSSMPRGVLLHVVVYRIADGDLAVSFAHLDDSEAAQVKYFGSAWIGVLKDDRWVTIEPRWLPPHAHWGPRSYTLAVQPILARSKFTRGAYRAAMPSPSLPGG